jgi:hypothetical protein
MRDAAEGASAGGGEAALSDPDLRGGFAMASAP